MNNFLTRSAHVDSERMFGSFMTANAIMVCASFFVASVILTVAMFLSPTDDLLLNDIFLILLSFGVVVIYSWMCSYMARRKAVGRLFYIEMNLFMWIVWALTAYAAFYCGVWSMIHPSGKFSFEPHWKNVLFTFGGWLAFISVVHIFNIGRAIQMRAWLYEAGQRWKP